jgi:YfiH family protein
MEREPVLTAAPAAVRHDGVPVWAFERGAWRVRFLGAGAPARDEALAQSLARFAPGAGAAAWLRQVHGATVLEARAGACGEGDALVVRSAGLAAAIATADCVPVVVVGRDAAVAVHAGWRGVVAGVVPRALAALSAAGATDLAAFVGPAIGGCCYQVGADVAAAVVAASAASVLVVEPTAAGEPARPRRDLPHVDLRRAVASQLATGGVAAITLVEACTRCRAGQLESYRRDGERAGRNLALVWREATAGSRV